jgi:aminobenzoyl-glutamate utilization protein B
MSITLNNARMRIQQLADQNRHLIEEVGSTVWHYAETGRNELNSAFYLGRKLEQLGFTVERGTGGYPTGFIGTFTTGAGPVLGLLCEYDALPGLSSTREGENGHGCGHNLFAAGAVGTAAVIKQFLEEQGISATVKVFGTPSEENYASKPFYAKQGLFSGVDCFMGFHPLEFNGVLYSRHNAIASSNYRFYGKAAHAGAEPELGVSALDAVEIMNVAVNYLREHVTPDVRIHYIITNGGRAANIVPDFASSSYIIRAQEFKNLQAVNSRVNIIAEAAAMATGCRVEVEMVEAFANTVLNRPLAELAQQNIEALGAPPFDDDDDENVRRLGLKRGLSREIRPLPDTQGVFTASTDEGDVSWVAPWIRICMATLAEDTPGHSIELTAQANAPAAYKGVLQTVKVCASTLAGILIDPCQLDKMKEYHRRATQGKQPPVIGDVFPDPLRFPEAVGVKLSHNSVIEVNPELTVLLQDSLGAVVSAYVDGEILGQATLAALEGVTSLPLVRPLQKGEIVTLRYKPPGADREWLLGYLHKNIIKH